MAATPISVAMSPIRYSLELVAGGGIELELVMNFGPAGPQGDEGPPGPPGAGAEPMLFTQAGLAATWTVNHNLGYRPKPTAYSVGGVELLCDITHTSLNQFVVNLNEPQGGFVLY